MRLLLDTHILIWVLDANPRLPVRMQDAIASADEVFVSAVTIFKIAVKSALGKLEVSGDVEAMALQAGCQPLSVSWAHGRDVGRLPFHHHDPFDRLLIAQARVEGLVLATVDRVFHLYDVPLL
jgi:PIN domain nuclease of toxin-antitoxin system